jgi:hypothetical protein
VSLEIRKLFVCFIVPLLVISGCVSLGQDAKDELYYKKPSPGFLRIIKKVYLDLKDTSNSSELSKNFKESLIKALYAGRYEIVETPQQADLILDLETNFYLKAIYSDSYFLFFKLGWPFSYGSHRAQEPGLEVNTIYKQGEFKWEKKYVSYETCGYLQKDYDGKYYFQSRIDKVVVVILKDMTLMQAHLNKLRTSTFDANSPNPSL